MTKDSNDFDGLGDSHLALWESKLTTTDEGCIRVECYILRYTKIHFDNEKLGAVVCSDYHEVCLFETMFKAGF